jgi:hypothetical protein
VLGQKLSELYDDIKQRFKSVGALEKVLVDQKTCSSFALKDRQSPEEFTKQFIIGPLMDFLGFETILETTLPSPNGRKKPDYIIRAKKRGKPAFYVEAEPLSTDLNSKDHGIAQVQEWLISRASKTDYGIATNGFKWVVLKFDDTSCRSKPILEVDLRPFFLKQHNSKAFITDQEIDSIKRQFLILDQEHVNAFLNGYLEKSEKEKEEISAHFYRDYVRYVFGFDEKGKTAKGVSLLKKIRIPQGLTEKDAKLFAVVFMNRIIFIKFLEEKKVVPKNLLEALHSSYESSNTIGTFYETYLKPLFYEVFNKSERNRPETVRTGNRLYHDIPYLNGGLFREVVIDEKKYDIENDGVDLVLEKVIEPYNLGNGSKVNPDILGYIFEKTINCISGTGTNQQKAQGAYYTPDDLVEYIIDNTVSPAVFDKMLQGLRKSGWTDTDLKGYNSVDDILEPHKIPKNPEHIGNMIASLDTIKIIDPACGSGHFLTAALSYLLRIKVDLLKAVNQPIERYQLKRSIVCENLFGVDIDENACEIARLRLWLSIIEEFEGNPSRIDPLPNIDFNILVGNSLIGWLHEPVEIQPLLNPLEDSRLKESFRAVKDFFGIEIERQSRIEDVINAYGTLIKLYKLESGDKAVQIREIIEGIRSRLYEVADSSFLDFLHEETDLNTDEFQSLCRGWKNLTPFHWRIDFENILKEGGFDVIVGNPPYGNILKTLERAAMPRYKTVWINEIAANFLERSFAIVGKKGLLGLVLANSIAINKSCSEARSLIRENMSASKMALFGTRPAKIFSGPEIRVMIFMGEVDKPSKKGLISTTEAIKFTSAMRPSLLDTLSFEDTEGLSLGKDKIGDNIEDSSLPKIGKPIIRDILTKLKNASKLVIADRINQPAFKCTMEFRKTGGYWLNALQEFPYKSTKIEKVCFETEIERDFCIALVNSSLFYLYWSTYSNLRDLPLSLLAKFPFVPFDTLKGKQTEIKKLKTDINKRLLRSFQPDTGRMGEFRTGMCRYDIDAIDDLLGQLYGLSIREVAFVKTYDNFIRS